MKKYLVLTIAILAIVSFMWCASPNPSFAQDAKLSGKIESVIIKIDKNGKQFVRFILPQTGTIDGVQYNKTVAVMAFDAHVAKAKTYKAGDTLNVIAQSRVYEGNTYYTILAFMPDK